MMNHTNNTSDVCNKVVFINIPMIALTFPCILLRYYCPKYTVCTNLVKYVRFFNSVYKLMNSAISNGTIFQYLNIHITVRHYLITCNGTFTSYVNAYGRTKHVFRSIYERHYIWVFSTQKLTYERNCIGV